MTASLGHGLDEIVAAVDRQARQISYVYNQQFTSFPQEELASELMKVMPEGMTRVHFVSGGTEANEMALRLAYQFHCERGEPGRTKFVSQAQAYHGPSMATLALTGRPRGLWAPFAPLITEQLYVPPSTRRFDVSGQDALEALDARIVQHGPESIAAFFCEPVSAASLPAYSPPPLFWKGLAERRDRYGFLVVLDEVVTGIGRTGTWFAAHQLPFVPDIITTSKGLGASYAPIGAVICRQHVYGRGLWIAVVRVGAYMGWRTAFLCRRPRRH